MRFSRVFLSLIESNNIKSPKSGFKSWRIEKNSVKPSKNPVKTQISILDRSITAFARGTPKKTKAERTKKDGGQPRRISFFQIKSKSKRMTVKHFFFIAKEKQSGCHYSRALNPTPSNKK